MFTGVLRALTGSGSATVLVVGDDDLPPEIRRALASEDLGVVFFSSVDQALDQLNDVDLVLVRGGLDAEGGREFCEPIKGLRKEVPVILIAARTDSHDVAIPVQTGADDYIASPFDPAGLVRLRPHVELRRARVAAVEHEAWLRTLLTSASDAIVVGDLECKYAAFGSVFSQHGFSTELIYTTVVNDLEALSVLENRVRLRNENKDPKTGELLLEIENPVIDLAQITPPVEWPELTEAGG